MINNDRVAIFSDLHLGVYANSETWHEIALEWADWIVSDLESNNIKDIFFLGDFFDNRSEINVQTMHVASKIIDKFKNFNLFIIVGNHDAYFKFRSDVHSLGLVKAHQNITLIDKNYTFSKNGKNFLFVPWANSLPWDGLEDVSEYVGDKYNYIFGHFEIQTFKMNNFTTCTHGLSPSNLLIGGDDLYTKVFTGHFHTKSNKKYKQGEIHYVGSCFSMDYSDVGSKKGYHILNINTGDLDFVENIVSPQFVKILLSDIKNIKNYIIKNNIIKFIVDSEIDEEKIDKIKLYISKLSPKQFTVEYNVHKKTLEDVEVIDSIDINEMFYEFIDNMKIEEGACARVKEILKGLLARSVEK